MPSDGPAPAAQACRDPPFAELCAKSAFSLLEGASRPEEMVARAHALGLSALALADRNGPYGAVRAHLEGKRLGLRTLVAAELPVGDAGVPVALVVRDRAGYESLCRLLTLAHAGRPRHEAWIDAPALAAGGAGLVALACPGTLEGADVDATIALLREGLAPWAFVATWRRLDGLDRAREASASRLARTFDVPMVATARPLFHAPSRRRLADVLQCIREKTTLDAAGLGLAPNAEAFLCSPRAMARRFADAPERLGRTVDIAAACTFSLGELSYAFPCDELAPGETPDACLRRLVAEGERTRYPRGCPAAVRTQLDKELALIARLGVAQFFLSVHDIVGIARELRILCEGRGSAANCAVCFVLGITAVDPARSSLLFERFLSAERHEPPDIDVDFEHERREEVIQAIYAKYGRDRAAMVSEVISYRGRSALRETSKVFGLSAEQVDRMASLVGAYERVPAPDADDADDDDANEHPTRARDEPWVAPREAGEGTLSARLREAGFDPSDARVRHILAIAAELQGLPRHFATHVGGFVLSARPLVEISPVEPAAMPGRTVVPWDKDDIDALGFFKVDVLGLGMLTALRKALALVHQRVSPGAPFDPIEALARIPPEDATVYDAICKADTIGVFQIESRAQMAMLPRLRPRCFYDLVIEVAIVRPGPIQGGMVHPYLRRRNGEEPARVPHPGLEPILARTLGVPLFQEQVMQIAIVGAGYSGGEADELRRDMAAWRKDGRLERHRARLLDGFRARSIPDAFSARLFEQIKGFGEYGFPESHAASFALLVYASAWVKVHHPAAFACALLDSQPMGFYAPATIVRDAQRHGVVALPVDVASSGWSHALEPDPSGASEPALRLGLRQVRGIGEPVAEAIERARAERPFADIDDLVARVGLRRDQLDRLAEAGALASLVPDRRQAMWQARAPRAGGLLCGVATREPRVRLARLAAPEQLALDYRATGLSLHDHPMCHLRATVARAGAVPASALAALHHGARVAVAGLVLSRQRPVTAKGVVFVSVEDETGLSNLILTLEVFERFRAVARHAQLVLARGRLERTPRTPEASVGVTPVLHVLVEALERLDAGSLAQRSRDFH